VTLAGMGQVSRLGRVQLVHHQVIVAPEEGAAVTGSLTFVAMNGDELHGEYVGEVFYAYTPAGRAAPVAFFSGEVTFTAGTGRLAGVEGTAELLGGYCYSLQVGSIDLLKSEITLPKT
jgi:hypothetical protein